MRIIRLAPIMMVFLTASMLVLPLASATAQIQGRETGTCYCALSRDHRPCGTCPRGGGGSLPGPSGPTPQELERRRQEQEQRREEGMHEANDLAVEYFRRGDWANAIRYFQQALERSPDDPVILRNLRRAQEELRNEQARRAEEARRAEQARQLELQRQRALKEALSAKEHGKQATATKDPSVDQSRKVFDTPGKPGGTLDPVDTRGTGGRDITKPRVSVPERLLNRPEVIRWQQERTKLVKEHQDLEAKLKAVREQKARGAGNRGALDVEEAKTKDAMSRVVSKIDTEDVKMESFLVNLSEAPTSTPAPQSPTPPASAGPLAPAKR